MDLKRVERENMSSRAALTNDVLEDQYVNLPSKIFKSWWTYELNELWQSLLFKSFLVSLVVAIPLVIYFSITNPILLIGIINVFLVPLILGSLAVSKLNEKRLMIRQDNENINKLFLEIIQWKPNVDPRSWDLIALHINQHLYEMGNWNTPGFFYDGHLVYAWFKPIRAYYIANEEQDRTVSTENSKNSILKKQEYQFKQYKKLAVEAYNAAVDDYWQDQYPMTASLMTNSNQSPV
ncbi:hypothetical protein NCAS_0I00840 [Naumovozyma castellii]|uniref:Uncharacterized protein n=1 Tax=Naumovozyma castellii TaxID=27288 RepID=G0VJS1_NAUCA|nr:hypothetical protein NCAS_0I00840 [Naumovozyma castellii CBS 4309]CCC71752.1 hypothetical protein NCAS_0I00840 [Naumovozyma castellii CBS 4309]